MNAGGPLPGGWYPDPGNEAQLRWWSGTAWTAHISPVDAFVAPPPGPPVWAGAAPSASEAVARGAKVARVLKALIVLELVVTVVVYGIGSWFLHDLLHGYLDGARSGRRPSLWWGALQVPSALLGLSGVALVAWAYQAAATGARLGVPARHGPGLAAGSFLIPVVSLWLPYQCLSDTIPAGRRRGVPLLRWWLLRIVASALALAVWVVSWWSTIGAGVLGVATATVTALGLLYLRRTIDGIGRVHESLLSKAGSPHGDEAVATST